MNLVASVLDVQTQVFWIVFFVEYYGVETPLNQLASITIPEARVLLITPFDKSSLKDIEHSINASDLGITPANDGSVIRLVIPALTEETRRDLAKKK